MQKLHRYFVYILTNKNKSVLYIGVTNNLEYRIQRHVEGGTFAQDAFTSRYKCYYLLYVEEYQQIHDAIAREKELKGWTRAKKIELIKTVNPEMIFLNGDC